MVPFGGAQSKSLLISILSPFLSVSSARGKCYVSVEVKLMKRKVQQNAPLSSVAAAMNTQSRSRGSLQEKQIVLIYESGGWEPQ